MAEGKRIEVTTVGPLKKDNINKKMGVERPTFRFKLRLSESNEKTCPEFNYGQLLQLKSSSSHQQQTVKTSVDGIKNGKVEKDEEDEDEKEEDGEQEGGGGMTKKKKKIMVPNDPFGETDEAEDERLKALAKKFEEKYAPTPATKKASKMGRMEDYIDLGMGYDETDSFIDNTDAYDELVPSTLTTQYGGFYINSGKLDFKEVNTESSDGGAGEEDEEEEEEEQEEMEEDEEDEIIDAVARRKKRQRLREMDKDVRKKRRLMLMATSATKGNSEGRGGGGVAGMVAGDGHNHHHLHHHHHSAIKKKGRKPMERNSYLHEGALLKPKKKQETVAILLQQRKAQQQKLQQRHHHHHSNQLRQVAPPSRTGQQEPNPSPRTSPSAVLTQSAVSRSGASPNQALQVLPTIHLPSDLALIADLARATAGPQATASINEIIESVIISSRGREANGLEVHPVVASASLSSDSDNPIFIGTAEGEVAPKLPEGLPDVLDEAIKQIKVAARKSGEGKCKFFSNEVNNMLLSIELMSRELSCSQRSTLFAHLASHLPCTKETLLKRAKKLRLDQEDGKLQDLLTRMKMEIDEVMPKIEDAYKNKCLAYVKGTSKLSDSSASDDDDECREEYGSSSQDEEKTDEKSPPVKKKFLWNDKIRMLLCDVVQIKMKCFEVSKTRTQSAEEYLRQFLDLYVKPLWPRGWMHSRKLMKESRLVHAHLTFRPKKHLLLAKKIGVTNSAEIVSTSVGIQGSVKCLPSYDTTRATASNKVSSSVGLVVPPSLSPSLVVTSARDTPPIKTTAQIQSSSIPTPNSSPSVIVVPTAVEAQGPITPTLTVQSSATEIPAKISGHVFSLLDPKVLRNATSNHSGSASTAEYFLSELISGALANFPNSSTVTKHSVGRDKFHESSLFTAAMNKCSTSTKVVSSSSSSSGVERGAGHKGAQIVSGDVLDSKVNFQVPKVTSKTTLPSVQKTDSHANSSVATGVSILKEYDRHASLLQRWTGASNLQDLRNSYVKTSSSHGVSGTSISTSASSSSSARKTPSPLKVGDLYLPKAVETSSEPSNSKISAALPTVPYHSLYNIKEAIQRGLQGQATGAAVSSKVSRSLVTAQHLQQQTQSSSGAFYSADLPLNFSTPRSSSSSADRISPSSRGGVTASSSHTHPSPPERSTHSQSPSSVSSHAPSVRTVSLPQPPNKYAAVQRSKHEPHQDYLEGIAASVREQHLKKSNRSLEFATTLTAAASTVATHRRGGGGATAANVLDGLIPSSSTAVKATTTSGSSPLTVISLSNHHVSLPKLVTSSSTSGYSEPVHSIPQGCSDLRSRQQQRFIRPTSSLQGDNTNASP